MIWNFICSWTFNIFLHLFYILLSITLALKTWLRAIATFLVSTCITKWILTQENTNIHIERDMPVFRGCIHLRAKIGKYHSACSTLIDKNIISLLTPLYFEYVRIAELKLIISPLMDITSLIFHWKFKSFIK